MLTLSLQPPAGRRYGVKLLDGDGSALAVGSERPGGEVGFETTLAGGEYYLLLETLDGSAGPEPYQLALDFLRSPTVWIDRDWAVPVLGEQRLTIRHSYTEGLTYTYRAVSMDEPWVSHPIDPLGSSFTYWNGEWMLERTWDFWYKRTDSDPDLSGRFPLMEGNWRIEVTAQDSTGRSVSGRSPELEVVVHRRPVLYVPGAAASYLMRCTNDCRDTDMVWPDEPFVDDAVFLEMSRESENLYGDIRPDGPILFLGRDFGRGLLSAFEQRGWQLHVNLGAWGYDWRLDVRESARQLDKVVQMYRLRGGAREIDIVAHSMGGLVSKYYLMYEDGARYVDTFITMGTPYLGAPKAFKVMVAGDNMGVPTVEPATLERVADTIPGIYQLMPSEMWFTKNEIREGGRVLYNGGFVDVYTLPSEPDEWPVRTLSYPETLELLEQFPYDLANPESPYRNWGMYSRYGVALHDLLDDKPIPGVKRHAVVSVGLGTIVGVSELRSFYQDGGYHFQLRYGDGDATVPTASAVTPGPDARIVYAVGVEHSKMMANFSIIEYLLRALDPAGDRSNDLPQGIYATPPANVAQGEYLILYCPVDLHVYDEEGNHTGPIGEGFVEYNVPGVDYTISGEDKHVFLPAGRTYRLVFEGTGDGTMDLHISRWSGDQMVQKDLYNKFPVTTDLTATMEITPMVGEHLLAVTQADGTQVMVPPDAVVVGAENLTPAPPPVAQATLTGEAGQNGWFVSDVTVSYSAQDQGRGVLSIMYKQESDPAYQRYTEPFLLTAEGVTVLLAGATDRLGFEQPEPTVDTVRIDKTPPEISVAEPESRYFLGDTFTVGFTATDSVSGLAAVSATLNGMPVQDGQTVTLDQVGRYELVVSAIDVAGHQAEERRSFVVRLPVTVDVDPNTLQLGRGKDPFVTVYVEFPAGYDARQIRLETVMLNGTVPAISDPQYGWVKSESSYMMDRDGDGLPERMFKFDRQAVEALAGQAGESLTLTITGEFGPYQEFEGVDTIRVLRQR